MTDDPLSLFWLFLLQFIFISFNALFAGAEVAVLTLNPNKLAKMSSDGDKRAIRLSKLIELPSGFLATVQVGITMINLLSSAVATKNFSDRLVDWIVSLGINVPPALVNVISMVFITLLLTYFTVLLGELIPKRIAMKNAEKFAIAMSGMIYWVSKIFSPAVWLFTVSTNGLLRLIGIDPNSEQDENTEEEIRMMLDAASQKGTILPGEQSMIHNIFEFDDTAAGEIMTHRIEVSLLWLDETDEQWEQTIIGSKHSRYPVCIDTTDHIVGILYSRDYLRLKNRSRDNVMEKAVHPAYFVPESVRADLLFRNMQQSRNHFAIVVDEYGGMSGIITISDLLEQLVGDLDDDISVAVESPRIERIDSQTWRIQGIAPLDEVAKELNVSLPIDEYDSFAGLVFGILGNVPDDGSTPELEEYGLLIKVTKITGRRLINAVVAVVDVESETQNETVEA